MYEKYAKRIAANMIADIKNLTKEQYDCMENFINKRISSEEFLKKILKKNIRVNNPEEAYEYLNPEE